jgi:hypothetical protein
MTPAFFKEFHYRAPNQYFADPLPRAQDFIQRKGVRQKLEIQKEVK